jgi:predicted DNA-binding helix-hairpin-helix protein
LAARRYTRLKLADVARLTAGLKRARPFIVTADYRPGALIDRADLRARLRAPAQQLSLF